MVLLVCSIIVFSWSQIVTGATHVINFEHQISETQVFMGLWSLLSWPGLRCCYNGGASHPELKKHSSENLRWCHGGPIFIYSLFHALLLLCQQPVCYYVMSAFLLVVEREREREKSCKAWSSQGSSPVGRYPQGVLRSVGSERKEPDKLFSLSKSKRG